MVTIRIVLLAIVSLAGLGAGTLSSPSPALANRCFDRCMTRCHMPMGYRICRNDCNYRCNRRTWSYDSP